MPPASDLLFRRLLKELRPALVEHGFRRSSQNFVIESAEGWGVINLTPYDAAYLDLAQVSRVPLATLDEDLILACRKSGVGLL